MPNSVDIDVMFLHADRMWKAADVVGRRIRGVAHCVLFGFASELFLKILIYHETNRLARGHNLERLYHQLAPGTQRAIRDQFDANYAKAERYRRRIERELPGYTHDVGSVLRTNAQVFEIGRYVYEVNQLQVVGIDLLARTLRQVVSMTLYPPRIISN